MLKKTRLALDFILVLVWYFSYLYNPLAPFAKGESVCDDPLRKRIKNFPLRGLRGLS
jgi:hypothetical protein